MKRSGARLFPNSRGSTCAGQITSTKVIVISEAMCTQPRNPESQMREVGTGMATPLWGFPAMALNLISSLSQHFGFNSWACFHLG